jgi:DNA-binding NtrC family response regulator
VDTAATFTEGQAKLQTAGPWDLVITDERLPDGRGVVLLGQVAISDPTAVRVLMSAHTDYEALMRGVNVGRIEHFVQKPFDALKEMVWISRSLEERDARRLAQSAPRPAP